MIYAGTTRGGPDDAKSQAAYTKLIKVYQSHNYVEQPQRDGSTLVVIGTQYIGHYVWRDTYWKWEPRRRHG